MADFTTVSQADGAKGLSHTRSHWLFLILALLPMVVIGAIIHQYGVNVPYGDEWDVISLFEKWKSHQLTFFDLYDVHNEHRILIPRLIYLAITEITHGNLRAEMFFSLFLCACISGCLYLFLRRTVNGSTKKRLLVWALINVFLFSPVQAENWLWGFQIQIFLANLFLVGALVCITSEVGLPLRLMGAFGLAVGGTFSFGNGVLIWPAVFGVLICRRENFRALIAWIVMALLVALAYIPNYPARETTAGATQWLDYLIFFAGFLGTPLARIPNGRPLVLPVILGSLLVIGYFGILINLVRRRSELRMVAPWLALGGYAMASAMMASMARIHFGPMHALDSRYTTVSMLLVVSVIGLVASISSRGQGTTSRSAGRTILMGAAVAVLLGLAAINVPFELRYLRLHRSFRDRGKGALQFSALLDLDQVCRETLLIRLDPPTFARSLAALDHFKLMDPPRRQGLALLDAEGRPKRATDEYGVFERLMEAPDAVQATGWSQLPGEGRPPAAVVLAYRAGEEWKAFALVEVSKQRPDVMERYATYLNSGWQQRIERTDLPADAREISAWALDANRGETVRLMGSFELKP